MGVVPPPHEQAHQPGDTRTHENRHDDQQDVEDLDRGVDNRPGDRSGEHGGQDHEHSRARPLPPLP